MIEVEIKLPLLEERSDDVESRIEALGFYPKQKVRETDIYFDNDRHQIRSNGQALRVRCIERFCDFYDEETSDIASVITFKGKKLDQERYDDGFR